MKSKLFINGLQIDLKDDISIPITYVTSDVKHATERRRSHSKPIVLPATAKNKNTFQSVWRLDYETVDNGFGFDATGRTEAQLYSDENLIFDGLFQLKKIVRLGDNYEIHGILYSNILDLMDKVGDLTIGELGWSEYNHTLNDTNITDTFNTQCQRPQLTTVATYDSPFGGAKAPKGFGYFYGLVDWGLAGSNRQLSAFSTTLNYPRWEHNELVPMFYLKEILYKMFDQADYTFEINTASGVTGLNYDETLEPATGTTANWTSKGQTLERILIAYEGGEPPNVSPAEITARGISLTGTGAGDILNVVQQNCTYIRDTEDPDTGEKLYIYETDLSNVWNAVLRDDRFSLSTSTDARAQYDATDGRITMGNSGKYKLEWSGTYTCSYEWLSAGSVTVREAESVFYLGVNKNGVQIAKQTIILDKDQLSDSQDVAVDLSMDLDVTQGDTLTLFVGIQAHAKATTSDENASFNKFVNTFTTKTGFATQVDLTCQNKVYQTGDTVEMNNWAPKLTCRELFKGFIRMFNLFVDEPDSEGHIKIYDYDTYYGDQSDAIDWTQKLDKSKKIEIIPATNIEGKHYKFRFTDETDDLNQFYLNRMKEQYGSRTYTVKSTYQKGDKVFQLPFAQSVMMEKSGGSLGTNTVIVPRIIETKESAVYSSAYSGAPRIFLNLGEQANVSGTWDLKPTSIAGATLQSNYPATGHLWYSTFGKGVSARSVDLNFSTPQEIYFTSPSAYESTNLWDFNKKFIEELTDIDSKLLVAYFHLTDEDIATLNFGTLINIDGVTWKVNEITDYRIGNNGSIRVELFKYLNVEQNSPTQTDPPNAPNNPQFP